MKRNFTIIVLLLLITLAGCSTKKNTWVNRQYHNLTARYNVYFNANESFKEASKRAEAIYPQSYDELLPVFAFSYPETPNTTMSDLDRTVSKSNKLITKHSITVKPKRKASPSDAYRKFYNRKEFNDMVDDAHLLIGKSQLYSQSYNEARLTFENIITNYPNQNSITEARVWLAVISAYTDDIEEAEGQLKNVESKLERDKEVVYSKKLRLTIGSAWADVYIKQGRYNEAIKKLEEAVKLARQRETKVRYRFILAQLYERTGNNAMATAYYEKIAKMNVPYEVQFSALMNKANTMDSRTQGKELEAQYKKMLANENNTEYFDQIYYALGNLAKTQGDTTAAIGYYKQSVEASVDNNIQKGLSSLALGSYYYSKQDYYPSYNGYSSATELLVNHPRQKYADSMTNMLATVGKNLNIVHREDSLQRIAKMDPTDRQEYADALAKAATQKKQEESQQYYGGYGYRTQYENQNTPGMGAQTTPTTGRWYFYNNVVVSQGSNEFRSRWGQRKLEDSWRRRNKAIATISDELEDELLAEGDELSDKTSTPADIPETSAEYYLQNVPLTEEAMSTSNARLERALYNLALAYRVDLHNNQKSLETFYRLLRDFPNNDNVPSIYYYIHQMLTEDAKYAEAETYKAKLISEFPEDRMALAIQNPNYLQDMVKLEAEAEQKYDEALALYRVGNHAAALDIANSSLQTYKGLTSEPNFALLKVLATSYNNDEGAYKEDLQNIIKSYPNTSASAAVKNILNALEGDLTAPTTPDVELPVPPKTDSVEEREEPTPIVVEEVSADQDYRYNENTEHYVLVVIDKDMQANQLAFNIALFNANKYLSQNYGMREEAGIDGNNKAIIISTFANKNEATSYYNSIMSEAILTPDNTLCFAISKDNLERLKLKKSLGGYVAFFKQRYLQEADIPTEEPEELPDSLIEE